MLVIVLVTVEITGPGLFTGHHDVKSAAVIGIIVCHAAQDSQLVRDLGNLR